MKTALYLSLTLVFALAMGCSQQATKQKVEKQIDEVILPDNNTPVAQTARDFILNSNDLSQDKKEALLALQEKVQSKSAALREEIEKTKVVLIQTVINPDASNRELAILKKKLIKLEKQRMDNGFEAMKEARSIINPVKASATDDFYKNYMHRHFEQFYY